MMSGAIVYSMDELIPFLFLTVLLALVRLIKQ